MRTYAMRDLDEAIERDPKLGAAQLMIARLQALPGGDRKRAIAAAVEHPDVNVRLLFEKHIPADQRPKTLGQQFKAEDILKLDGNVERGAQVFARSGAAACSKCHRVKGQGADVGPELSQIGRKYEKKALLETIMNPSAGIAPEYYPYVVETDTGKVFAEIGRAHV